MSMGAIVGLLETFMFAHFDFGAIRMLELVVAICVGIAAGALGCGIRIKGTTV